MTLSIIWIFIYHIIYFSYSLYNQHILWKIANYLFSTGYIGVDIFFFLSIYGLCHSNSNNNIKNFYYRRLKKIYPLYAIFLLIIFFTVLDFYTPINIIIYSLLQGSGLAVFKCFNSNIEWFVPSLIFIYTIFPLLYILTKKTKFHSDIICIILLNFSTPYIAYIIYDNLAYRIPIITMAILTYKYQNTQHLLYCYLTSSIFSLFNINDIQKYSCVLPMILFFINYILANLKTRNLHNKYMDLIKKTFLRIGKITFHIYLAQVITTKYLLPNNIGNYAFFNITFCLITTFILTFILYYIERYLSFFIWKKQELS